MKMGLAQAMLVAGRVERSSDRSRVAIAWAATVAMLAALAASAGSYSAIAPYAGTDTVNYLSAPGAFGLLGLGLGGLAARRLRARTS